MQGASLAKPGFPVRLRHVIAGLLCKGSCVHKPQWTWMRRPQWTWMRRPQWMWVRRPQWIPKSLGGWTLLQVQQGAFAHQAVSLACTKDTRHLLGLQEPPPKAPALVRCMP